MKNRPIYGLFLVCALLLAGIDSLMADDKPVVYVAVPPYVSIVESLGGEHFEVKTLVDENDDPHTFFPGPKDVTALTNAAIYFTAGMPFEEDLPAKLQASKKSPKIVALLKGISLLEGTCDHHEHAEHKHDHADHKHDHADHKHDHADHKHEHAEHKHDHADHKHDHADHKHEHADHKHEHTAHKHEHADHDDHDHGEFDPHVWLSPSLLAAQAEIIAGELTMLVESEEKKKEIQANLSQLISDITATDKALVKALAPVRGTTFYVYHGAFAYFADAYGLKQKAIELNGRSPEPKELVALVKQAKKDEVSVIFVQPQFDTSSAESLAEAIGGTVLPIDPLAEDVLGNLTEIAKNILGK